MRVLSKQKNSKMCIICGMDNPYSLKAQFYNMEDESVMALFTYREGHQSYPGRVHGGMITALLDEMGLRALWAKEGGEKTYGVTLSLETKYRKPVPYDTELIGKGVIVSETAKFVQADCLILDKKGTVLANAVVKYLKLDMDKIADGADEHEEMCYLIKDDVREINFEEC